MKKLICLLLVAFMAAIIAPAASAAGTGHSRQHRITAKALHKIKAKKAAKKHKKQMKHRKQKRRAAARR